MKQDMFNKSYKECSEDETKVVRQFKQSVLGNWNNGSLIIETYNQYLIDINPRSIDQQSAIKIKDDK